MNLSSMETLSVLFTDGKVLAWSQYSLYHIQGEQMFEVDQEKSGGGFVNIHKAADGFVGVRGNGDVVTSKDGLNWEHLADGPAHRGSTTGSALTESHVVIIYGGGIYFAARK